MRNSLAVMRIYPKSESIFRCQPLCVCVCVCVCVCLYVCVYHKSSTVSARAITESKVKYIKFF